MLGGASAVLRYLGRYTILEEEQVVASELGWRDPIEACTGVLAKRLQLRQDHPARRRAAARARRTGQSEGGGVRR